MVDGEIRIFLIVTPTTKQHNKIDEIAILIVIQKIEYFSISKITKAVIIPA